MVSLPPKERAEGAKELIGVARLAARVRIPAGTHRDPPPSDTERPPLLSEGAKGELALRLPGTVRVLGTAVLGEDLPHRLSVPPVRLPCLVEKGREISDRSSLSHSLDYGFLQLHHSRA